VRALVALMLSAMFLGWAAPVVAQREAPAAQEPAPSKADRWGDGRVNSDPREQPALGAPYNWRQMAFGAAIMLAMLVFVIWLVRRHGSRG
jgi:hypothetical protein